MPVSQEEVGLPQVFRCFDGRHICYRVDGYGNEEFMDDGYGQPDGRYVWGGRTGSIRVRDAFINTPRAIAYDAKFNQESIIFGIDRLSEAFRSLWRGATITAAEIDYYCVEPL